ncbi:MAG: hypothetical protein J6C09_04815 [Clostridia bacterium]|nr:hypothetical protein [Clostridia bacterium]
MEDDKNKEDTRTEWPAPFALVRMQGRICPIPIPLEEAEEVQKAIDEDEAEIARKKSLSRDT